MANNVAEMNGALTATAVQCWALYCMCLVKPDAGLIIEPAAAAPTAVCLTVCRPCRLPMLDASVKACEDASAFDTSRLVEFSERLLWEGPVLGLSPLVREPGRLAITDQRVYFQPLHNIAGAQRVLQQLPKEGSPTSLRSCSAAWLANLMCPAAQCAINTALVLTPKNLWQSLLQVCQAASCGMNMLCALQVTCWCGRTLWQQ